MSSKLFNTLVLDVGTTSVKAFVFDSEGRILAKTSNELHKNISENGYIEQDPEELVSSSIASIRSAVQESGIVPDTLRGLGIATQRETVIAWNMHTGKPLYPAIVWQDSRTEGRCADLQERYGKVVQEKTGLPILSYFSASKMEWIYKNVPEASSLISQQHLALGTVDSWLLWNLTDDHVFKTDYTNASRTLLFNIHTLAWDDELLRMFGIPASVLPSPQQSCSHFGQLHEDVLGIPVPINAVAGDQQASLFAVGYDVGVTKITYGTGTFVMQVIGSEFVLRDQFFTTVAIHPTHAHWYALEAKAFGGVEHQEAIVKDSMQLDAHLRLLVAHADPYIAQLPHKPSRVVIDGGWARDGKLVVIHQEESSYSVRAQSTYDGTALGIYQMMKIGVQ